MSGRVLVIGDSWASGVVAGNSGRDWDSRSWPMLLGIPAELRQAIGGSTAESWASDQNGRLSRALETKADCVVVSLLGNDFFAAVADGAVSGDEIARGVKALRIVYAGLVVRFPRVIALLYADPFHGADPGVSFACALLNVTICSAFPVGSGIEVLDTREILATADFINADEMPPHPTAAGHVQIARYLEQLVEFGRVL